MTLPEGVHTTTPVAGSQTQEISPTPTRSVRRLDGLLTCPHSQTIKKWSGDQPRTDLQLMIRTYSVYPKSWRLEGGAWCISLVWEPGFNSISNLPRLYFWLGTSQIRKDRYVWPYILLLGPPESILIWDAHTLDISCAISPLSVMWHTMRQNSLQRKMVGGTVS